MESECVKMQKEAEEEFGNHCMSRFETAVYYGFFQFSVKIWTHFVLRFETILCQDLDPFCVKVRNHFMSRFGSMSRGLEPFESRFGTMCRGL